MKKINLIYLIFPLIVLLYFYGHKIKCEENKLSCNVAHDSERLVFTSNEYETSNHEQVTLRLKGFSLSEYINVDISNRNKIDLISKSCDNQIIKTLNYKITIDEVTFNTIPGCWTYNLFVGYEYMNINYLDRI